jgi:RNA polymerase sigma-70 factor (ECF subfamily)
VPGNDPRSDAQLVAALNSGDASAFDALYYRYRDRVLRLAFRFTSNHADAQDVLQETFTYFYRKFPAFELTSQLTTFLYPVVRNLSLVARRKRLSGAEPIPDDLPGFEASNPDLSRSELSAAMANLSVDHRQVVLLRFVDDLTIDEIAAAMGIPAGTVKSRLHHAIAALRQDPRIRKYFDFP